MPYCLRIYASFFVDVCLILYGFMPHWFGSYALFLFNLCLILPGFMPYCLEACVVLSGYLPYSVVMYGLLAKNKTYIQQE